jgi:hypothetical protein
MKKIAVLGSIIVLLLVLVAGCGSSGKGSFRVTITNEGAAPLTGAKVVSEYQPDGQLKVTGITAGDGKVTFNDIQAGTYRFYVSVAGFQQQEFEVTVTAGRTAENTVSMIPVP